MTTLDTLKEADIKQVLNSSSRKKAAGYVSLVKNGVRNGRSLRADVQGSRLYQVEIDVAEDGIHAVCSCPYDWGGYCKHIGAVLLKWQASPGSFVAQTEGPAASTSVIETVVVEAAKTAVPKQQPFWLTHPHSIRSQAAVENLRKFLNEYKVSDLRQMAKEQGWSIKGTRKDDLIQQLVDHMLQPGIALKSMVSLDAEHLQVLQAMGVLYAGIAYQDSYLEALAKQWGPLTKHKHIKTYTSHLCGVGLAIPAQFSHSYLNHIDFIPGSITRILPPLLTDRVPETTLPEHATSSVQPGDSQAFLHRLHQVWLLLEQMNPPLRQPMPRPRLEKYHTFLQKWDYIPEEIKQAQQANKINKYSPKQSFTVPPPHPALPNETIKRLSSLTSDEEQLNFIYHLLVHAGLLLPGSPVTVWREMKEQFLRLDEAAQWTNLILAYFSLTTWNEVWSVLAERPSLQLKRSRKQYYRELQPEDLYGMLSVFRAQVLQILACLPDNRWFDLREVNKLLHPIWPRFDSWCWSPTRYGGDMQPDWFLEENGRFLDTAANKADWNMAQGTFIQQIIQGSLHWLGVADISVEYGRLVAFRLHGLNAIFFDKTESVPLKGTAQERTRTAVPTSSPTQSITIEGTAIIINPTTVSAQAHNYLDSIALLETAETTRFVYQLNTSAVHESFENGQTLTQIMEGWQQWLNVPMPENIQTRLTAWWQSYGLVRLYENVTVIEFNDDYALAEMKAATSLEKHLIAEISPRLVIIPKQAIDTLVNEMEKAGYTPKQTQKV